MTEILETGLPGVLLMKPEVFGDSRGFFLETFQAERYCSLGVPTSFVQDNHSRSQRGVLRGLHFQLRHPQGKLVQVIRGEVYDVAVDVRSGSPTFGQSFGIVLSDKNHLQLFIPAGFAHGFCVLSETADFVYKCTDYYHPEDECGVLWNDPELQIEWPFSEVQLSDRDQGNPGLGDLPPEMLPRYAEDAVA